MSTRNLTGTTAVVTGASRGFGRATAIALAGQGARVVGVARNQAQLEQLAEELSDRFIPEVADAADPAVAARIVAEYQPTTLVLNAGATPKPAPLSGHSWETFSINWDVDVRHVFNFTREALTAPLAAGSVVVSLSSGAAVNGSPLSGGYAGAKGTIKFISAYAAMEASQTEAGIRFVSVLPQLTPATGIGRVYTNAYANQAQLSETEFLDRFGGVLSTEQAAGTITELITDDRYTAPAYLLTLGGLRPTDN